MPSVFGKRLRYDVDDIRHGMAELKDRWENRLTLDKLNIAEEYVRGNLCVILEGKARSNRGAVNRECFAGTELGGVSVEIGERATYFASLTEKNKLINGGGMDNWHQGGVFICVVKSVDNIQEVARSAGERLKRLEECLDGRGWCFYSATCSFVTRSIASFREVELCVLAAAINPDHFPHEMVEGTVKVVDSVAYYQGETGGGGRDGEGDELPFVAMTDRRIEVVPGKSRKLPFQVSDVMVGPFDL